MMYLNVLLSNQVFYFNNLNKGKIQYKNFIEKHLLY